MPSRPVARPILSAKICPTSSADTAASTDKQLARRQSPQHQVGVGDGRLRAAAAVADRPRIGAGAFRPDLNETGRVDAGDRAAAGPDRVHVDHRHVDRHRIFDLDLVGDGRLGIADQGDVGRGAAHIVADEVAETGAPAGIGSGDDTRGRPRHHGLCRVARDETGRDHAAIAVHDQEVAGIAAPGKLDTQSFDITLEDRTYRGVDRRRDATLELTRFRQQRVTHRDVTVRPDFGGDVGGAALMRGIGVRVQEVNDQRFAASLDESAGSGTNLVLVERHAYIA